MARLQEVIICNSYYRKLHTNAIALKGGGRELDLYMDCRLIIKYIFLCRCRSGAVIKELYHKLRPPFGNRLFRGLFCILAEMVVASSLPFPLGS